MKILLALLISSTAQASDFGRWLEANPKSVTAQCFDKANESGLHKRNYARYRVWTDLCFLIGKKEMKVKRV